MSKQQTPDPAQVDRDIEAIERAVQIAWADLGLARMFRTREANEEAAAVVAKVRQDLLAALRKGGAQ